MLKWLGHNLNKILLKDKPFEQMKSTGGIRGSLDEKRNKLICDLFNLDSEPPVRVLPHRGHRNIHIVVRIDKYGNQTLESIDDPNVTVNFCKFDEVDFLGGGFKDR